MLVRVIHTNPPVHKQRYCNTKTESNNSSSNSFLFLTFLFFSHEASFELAITEIVTVRLRIRNLREDSAHVFSFTLKTPFSHPLGWPWLTDLLPKEPNCVASALCVLGGVCVCLWGSGDGGKGLWGVWGGFYLSAEKVWNTQ